MSTATVAPPPEVIFQDLGDEVVLLNMVDQRYFGLDDVGSQMWKLLVEHGDVETVTDRICAEYDVDRATAHADLGALIKSLIGVGLLKPLDHGAVIA